MEQPLVTFRRHTTELLDILKEQIKNSKAPVVQELILAQRHLEDARMRVGVAVAYQNEQDPWSTN